MKKLNNMCKNCIAFYAGGCAGSYENVYTGCVYKNLPEMEMQHDNRIYKLALMIPGLLYYTNDTDIIAMRALDDVILSFGTVAHNSLSDSLEKIRKCEIEHYYISEILKISNLVLTDKSNNDII